MKKHILLSTISSALGFFGGVLQYDLQGRVVEPSYYGDSTTGTTALYNSGNNELLLIKKPDKIAGL
jgi:hypothetical protein